MATLRSTTDIVVILLTAMVASIMVLGTIGLIIIRITSPSTDVKPGAELLGNVLTTIVGALVGFVGGRAAGRAEGANNNNKPKLA